MPSSADDILLEKNIGGGTTVTISGSKNSLNEWIWQQTQGIVQSGPFAGMQLPQQSSWDDGNTGNKCLGCYEQEFHEPVEQEIFRLLELDNPKIVNLGCAEGYYAVGLARRLPKATVHIVDSSDEALRICHAAATMNDVTVQSGSELMVILNGADLIVCDCEGAENAYIDPERYPGLKHASMLVEMHDFPGVHNTEIIYGRFCKTHMIAMCQSEMMRAPGNYEILFALPSHAKWMAVSEGRPCLQNLMYLRPK
jgi:hypothetical protein